MVRFRNSRYTLRGWSYCGQYAEAPCLCAAAKRRRRSRSSLPFKPLGSFVRVPREPADGNGVERSCRRSSQRPLRGPESRPLQLLRFCEFPLPVQVSLFVLTLVLQFAAHRFVVRCCPLCGCPPFQVLCPGPCPCAEWPRRCQKRRGSSHHFHLGHLTGPAAGAGGAEGAEGRGVLCRQAGVSAQGAGCEASKCESLVRVDQGSNSRPVTPHPATFCWTGARNHPRKRAAQPTGLKRMPPWKIWFCS